jgi:hypothetical protein
MSDNKFFSISGLGVAAHTPETKKIWCSWENNKSDYGRVAVLNYAKDLGFEYDMSNEATLGIVEEAFRYLLSQFPDISGVKSFILRQAIIHYS